MDMKSTKRREISIEWVEDALASWGAELTPKELALCRRNYAPPVDRYYKRIMAIGFEGKKRVLDACCGFGQWALTMAQANHHVEGCDISPVRVSIVLDIARTAGIDNLTATACSLTELPYEADTFDAIFCYVALNCTPWKESLRELARVLEPGGQLYFTANGFGYQVKQWVEQPHKSPDRSPRDYAAIALRNTLDYEARGTPPKIGQIITEMEEMRDFLQSIGLEVLALEDEGHIDVTGGHYPPFPFFPGTYNGMTCCYEVLAVKPIRAVS
jgi:ubiquinone/menaquinone biosynthesis C-methylase UbiE